MCTKAFGNLGGALNTKVTALATSIIDGFCTKLAEFCMPARMCGFEMRPGYPETPISRTFPPTFCVKRASGIVFFGLGAIDPGWFENEQQPEVIDPKSGTGF